MGVAHPHKAPQKPYWCWPQVAGISWNSEEELRPHLTLVIRDFLCLWDWRFLQRLTMAFLKTWPINLESVFIPTCCQICVFCLKYRIFFLLLLLSNSLLLQCESVKTCVYKEFFEKCSSQTLQQLPLNKIHSNCLSSNLCNPGVLHAHLLRCCEVSSSDSFGRTSKMVLALEMKIPWLRV